MKIVQLALFDKRCSQCAEVKPLSEYYRHSGSHDGLKGYCKPCGRAASSAYYREHAADQNAKASARYRADPSRASAYGRDYRAKHRARIATAKRLGAAVRRAHGWRRTYSDAERQRVQIRSARWYAANAEHAKSRASRYRRQNRDKYTVWGEAYRAKRRSAGTGVTAARWVALLVLFGNKCLACGVSERLTMDHVQPLSQGGAHDVRNVQPLCKSCNSRKAKHLHDYRPSGWESRLPGVQATAA